MSMIGRAVGLHVATVLTVAPPTPAATPEGPEPLPSAQVQPGETRGCGRSPRCVRLTAIGSTFGVLGLGAVVTGSVLLVQPDEPLPDDPTTVKSTRPAGTVLVALGAGVLVSSIVMLVAAHRGRSRTTARQVGPTPGAEVRF